MTPCVAPEAFGLLDRDLNIFVDVHDGGCPIDSVQIVHSLKELGVPVLHEGDPFGLFRNLGERHCLEELLGQGGQSDD